IRSKRLSHPPKSLSEELQDVPETEIETLIIWTSNLSSSEVSTHMGKLVFSSIRPRSADGVFSFERPSAIQQRAIIPVLKGHDVIAQ
ncbi:11763_t:CDS:2, partial [Acaulospora colombiana]